MPTTGNNSPEPVTQLHDNHDTDLTDDDLSFSRAPRPAPAARPADPKGE